MNTDHARLDLLRADGGEVAQHVIDEFVAGHLSRRRFLARAALVGVALPTISAILAACGIESTDGPTLGPSGKPGATIRSGAFAPRADPNPLHIIDFGGIQMLGLVGEALIAYDATNTPRPSLATSWEPNADGTVWVFKIRQGVVFSDGSPMTVDDVVYSIQTHADPANAANDLSIFGGILDPSGVVKVDDETVAFHLEVPYGAFPAAVSTANYNLIIVPKNTDYDRWSQTFIGTGPFVRKEFDIATGATFVPNARYWGGAALPGAVELTFFADEQPMAAALQAQQIDCMQQFTVATSPQLLDGSYNVLRSKGSAHRALSMRTDLAPFDNKDVRQALALTLDRPAIVEALFHGYADVGNDSPFAPSFQQTDLEVPQRKLDIAGAKRLLEKAGMGRGFSTSLYTERFQEIPQLAQIIKESASKIGIDIELNVLSVSDYYGAAVFGNSHWLDAPLSLVDYGARPVPNVFLQAPLQTTDSVSGQGSWNSAHFANAEYDALSKQYAAAIDLTSQRAIASEIQELLLEETPVVYPYFYDYLAASQKKVYGLAIPTQGALDFRNVTK